MTREVIRRNREQLRASCAGAETVPASIAEAGAWFAITSDVKATEIGLLHTGPAGARIGIREVTTSDVFGLCAPAASSFRVSLTAVVVSGGRIDPVSPMGATIAIGHLRSPRTLAAATGPANVRSLPAPLATSPRPVTVSVRMFHAGPAERRDRATAKAPSCS
jgi:hypothetical protein